MRQSNDISSILRQWEYDSQKCVRRIQTPKGREVLQVRLPLGIEQYEINGRPDGKRPEGCESLLHYFQKKSQIFGREFVLTEKECEDLQNEGILFYYRYLLFFQISEYALCSRDTARNLRLLDFVSKYASRKEHAEPLEQYRPYILRMHIMARTLHRLNERKDLRAAIRSLKQGAALIQALPSIHGNMVFDLEKERSLKSIQDLIRQLSGQLPPSKRDLLEKQMKDAISKEDYEKAATIRDQIRKLSRD